MDEKPRKLWRHWLQFRLSTWLVLVMILAWVMATRPYVVERFQFARNKPHGSNVRGMIPVAGHKTGYTFYVREANPRLRYPALALVAFITWKAFWLIRERRRERAAVE